MLAFGTSPAGSATEYFLDPPEDEIAVGRCGIKTTLGTSPYGLEVDLRDSNDAAFTKLQADLRTVIFSERWVSPTPSP